MQGQFLPQIAPGSGKHKQRQAWSMCTFGGSSNQTRSLTVSPRALCSRLQRLQPFPDLTRAIPSVLSALKSEADRFKSYLAVDVSMMWILEEKQSTCFSSDVNAL